VLVHEQAVDAVIDIKRNEAIGRTRCSAATPRRRRVSTCRSRRGSGTVHPAELRTRDARLYVSDHPLFGIEHIIARESDCSLAELMAEEAEPSRSRSVTGRTRRSSRSAASCPGCSAR